MMMMLAITLLVFGKHTTEKKYSRKLHKKTTDMYGQQATTIYSSRYTGSSFMNPSEEATIYEYTMLGWSDS